MSCWQLQNLDRYRLTVMTCIAGLLAGTVHGISAHQGRLDTGRHATPLPGPAASRQGYGWSNQRWGSHVSRPRRLPTFPQESRWVKQHVSHSSVHTYLFLKLMFWSIGVCLSHTSHPVWLIHFRFIAARTVLRQTPKLWLRLANVNFYSSKLMLFIISLRRKRTQFANGKLFS